jgi:intraflagellar transport protein 140
LYQASGSWEKALDVAENHDRIHLKTTHFSLASHLEAQGHIDEAMRHFHMSGTHRTEVPRILFANKRINELEEYITRGPAAGDEEMTVWWAGYLESVGSMDRAKKYYNEAKDFYSLVRIACFEKDLKEAKQIVDESNSPAAAYYFARYLEGQNEIQEAIGYYALSKCYNHAIRLAKNFGLDADLMPYALKCNSPPLMIDVALYFEKKGELEKAVQLYQRAGDIPKALDICFKAGAEAPVSWFVAYLFYLSCYSHHL